MEKQEQQCDLNAFCGEVVGVTAALAIRQAMAFEFAEIVAKWFSP